jgi:prevent-host-death family protein
MESAMTTVTALEAKNRFGKLLEMAQRGPVTVTKNGRPSAVVLSEDEYERLRKLGVEELLRHMDKMGAEAKARGMTDEILEELLAEDS